MLERFWLYTSLPESLGLGGESQYSKNMKDLDCLQSLFWEIASDRVVRTLEGSLYPNEQGGFIILDDKKIDILYQTYKKANYIVLEILKAVVRIAFAELDGWCDYPTALTLEELEMLLKTMQVNNIPLPEVEKFKKYELGFDPLKNISQAAETKALGMPFHGREEFSQILK